MLQSKNNEHKLEIDVRAHRFVDKNILEKYTGYCQIDWVAFESQELEVLYNRASESASEVEKLLIDAVLNKRICVTIKDLATIEDAILSLTQGGVMSLVNGFSEMKSYLLSTNFSELSYHLESVGESSF